ncbi:MAG: hypothetical protein P8I55_14050 [Crocinitomix sp.]|nr:hypothetical protein [Crocinitomix sp.]
MKKVILIALMAVFVTSCMTTKTTVGDYNSDPGKEFAYDKGKQFWLFWGLVPIGRQNVDTPADGTFEMEEKFKLGDFLISGLTGGIVSSRTIKCLDKK